MTARLDLDPNASDGDLLKSVVSYYHQRLLASPKALAYLDGRCIRGREVIERFTLGLADRTLTMKLPSMQVKAGRAIRNRLVNLGVIRDSGHEHFNGSVTVPIFDADGNVAQVYGRKITPRLRHGTPLHTWLPATDRPLFNLDGLGETVIVTGSIIDALTAWSMGFTSVTAVIGDNLGEEQLATFTNARVGNVILGFRRDADGDRRATALAEQLASAGMVAFRAQLPAGADINDVARLADNPQEALDAAFRSATWLAGVKAVQVPEAVAATPEPEHPQEEAATEPTPTEETPISEPPLPPASPLPQVPTAPNVQVQAGEDEVVVLLGDRRYRVRGLGKATSFDSMRVNVMVSRPTVLASEAYHLDTLDLYQAKQRAALTKVAAVELGIAEDVLRHDLGRLLLQRKSSPCPVGIGPARGELGVAGGATRPRRAA